jgi:hypothetical protein
MTDDKKLAAGADAVEAALARIAELEAQVDDLTGRLLIAEAAKKQT